MGKIVKVNGLREFDIPLWMLTEAHQKERQQQIAAARKRAYRVLWKRSSEMYHWKELSGA